MFKRNLLKMEAAYSFKMLVIYQTTQHHIPENCDLAEIISNEHYTFNPRIQISLIKLNCSPSV
jgi:hypothetical protein